MSIPDPHCQSIDLSTFTHSPSTHSASSVMYRLHCFLLTAAGSGGGPHLWHLLHLPGRDEDHVPHQLTSRLCSWSELCCSDRWVTMTFWCLFSAYFQVELLGEACWLLRRQSFDIINQLKGFDSSRASNYRYLLCILEEKDVAMKDEDCEKGVFMLWIWFPEACANETPCYLHVCVWWRIIILDKIS